MRALIFSSSYRGKWLDDVVVATGGLVPCWSPDPSIGNHMINARDETITEKPSYRRLVESKRCLIPADGFYEWRREGNRKVPVCFHLKNKQPFAFAGLRDMWRDPQGELLYTFTIIPNTAQFAAATDS